MTATHNGNSGVDESPIIYTTDEEGVDHRFQMLDIIEVDGRQYGLLLYLGNEKEEAAHEHGEGCNHGHDEEIVVMRIIDEDGEQVFEAIEDEAEFERVVAYVEQMDEEEDEEE